MFSNTWNKKALFLWITCLITPKRLFYRMKMRVIPDLWISCAHIAHMLWISLAFHVDIH